MKFIKIISYFIFTLLGTHITYAQGETSNWYFGRSSGIKFNGDGSVTPLSDGQINTLEGCATISDGFGNLLFYSDGTSVWNKYHQIMANGRNLYGNSSSTQSAIIVPQPESPNIYYIFTIDTALTGGGFDDDNNGFNYSIVDMSLDNGNGDITTKNENLISISSEKISAVVKDCFEGSIWVITFASQSGTSVNLDTYYSYEVSSSGINPIPIKSTFSISSTNPDTEGIDARGYLKISPDGTKVASANIRDGLYIYDFDASLGVFTNQQKINININDEYPYGLEFSPSNQYLYVNTYNDLGQGGNSGDAHKSSLIQFDLTASNIGSSRIILDKQDDLYRGALQLAKNGKIYRTLPLSYNQGSPYLGVINNPDLSGLASNYQNNAVFLGDNRSATQGLPPFIQSLFNKIDIINNPTSTSINTSALDLCIGDSYTLTGDDIAGANYVWYKDGNIIPNSSYTLDLTNVTNADEGFYELEITVNPGDCPILGEALVTVFDINQITDSSLIQCDIDENSEDGIAFFNLNNAYNSITGVQEGLTLTFYKNSDDLNNGFEIENPEEYTNEIPDESLVVVVSNNSCSAPPINLTLTANPTTIIEATTAQYFSCDENPNDNVLQAYFDFNDIENDFSGPSPIFYFTLKDMSIDENPISGSHLLENNTIIYVKVGGATGLCEGIETFTLYVDEKPEVQLPSVVPFVCLNLDETIISAPNGFDGYSWYYIDENNDEFLVSTTQDASINQPGDYRLEVAHLYTDFGVSRTCTNSGIFNVPESNIATITPEPEINDFSENNTITVFTEGEGDYEFALNNVGGPYQDDNIFQNVPSGFLTIYVRDKNGCGITSEDVAVIGYPKFFTPTNDNINDYWNIHGVSEFLQENSRIQIYDRYGKILSQISPSTLGWDGTYKGQPMPASDYWFSVYLQDGRNFKGHFTLKR